MQETKRNSHSNFSWISNESIGIFVAVHPSPIYEHSTNYSYYVFYWIFPSGKSSTSVDPINNSCD
jgi:hypothetical protein